MRRKQVELGRAGGGGEKCLAFLFPQVDSSLSKKTEKWFGEQRLTNSVLGQDEAPEI